MLPKLFVLRSAEAIPVIARRVVVALVVVELPCTTRSPLMVEEAESSPVEKLSTELVALPGNKYAKVGSPKLEVAVKVYPPVEFPTSMFPKEGVVESPVPP